VKDDIETPANLDEIETPVELRDPQERGPKPPLPEQQQEMPGSDAELTPAADHGETSYRGSGRLKGLRAIITGGDSGIGRAVAIAFAREGADVLVSYLDEHEDAETTIEHVTGAGRKGVAVAGDVGDEAHCKEIVRRAVEELGGVDILVNNAAFQSVVERVTHITSEEFDRTFKTNIYAMFYLVKACVPHLKPGSSIINTASVQAYSPTPTLLAYASTKGAIVTFTQALAEMLGGDGIRVNAVAPGPVWTPLIPSTFPAEKVKTFGKDVPLGRPAQPAELAPIYVLLASPEASYVSGAVYAATGGKPTA